MQNNTDQESSLGREKAKPEVIKLVTRNESATSYGA
jgi:hypothetical protein